MQRIFLVLLFGLGITASIQASPLFGRLFLTSSDSATKDVLNCKAIDMSSGWKRFPGGVEQKGDFMTPIGANEKLDYFYVVLNKKPTDDGILFEAGVSEAVRASDAGGFGILLEDLYKIKKIHSGESVIQLGGVFPSFFTAKFEISQVPCADVSK